MLPRFFIDRPIFAWVIALIVMIVGALGLSRLPVEQYPTVAPPTVSVNVANPGASAKMIEETVIELLEREINGTPKMIYMESSALANGTGSRQSGRGRPWSKACCRCSASSSASSRP